MILATVENMERYARPGLVAIDNMGNHYSATPGDYFAQPSNVPLLGPDGEPLILAVRVPETFRPLEDES